MLDTSRHGDLLILGATAVLPDGTRNADVRVRKGLIHEISQPNQLQHEDDELLIDGT